MIVNGRDEWERISWEEATAIAHVFAANKGALHVSGVKSMTGGVKSAVYTFMSYLA